MALFFHSHKCNEICISLGLSKFDLTSNELNDIKNKSSPSSAQPTMVKLDKVMMCESPSVAEKLDFSRFFRGRSGSCGFVDYEKHMSVSESSDLASSPPISYKDDDIGVHFKIEEIDNDNESRCSTATSDDSGLGRVGLEVKDQFCFLTFIRTLCTPKRQYL